MPRMPEGPEVETVRRTLLPLLVARVLGRPSVSTKALRTRVSTRSLSHLEGKRVVDVGRHGKTLFIALDDGGGVCVHLGMTGRLLVVDAAAARAPHTHVRVPLTVPAGPARELRYVDARRFGAFVPYADEAARARVVAGMGPDGLALDGPDGRALVAAALARTRRSLKDALLDQRVVAGVGNIYAAEILWTARLSPFRASSSLKADEARRLLDAVGAVLAAAVARRGTSFSDYVDATGAPGENAQHLAVFQREGEPCPACGTTVLRKVQGQRSTFYCPRCQRRPRLG